MKDPMGCPANQQRSLRHPSWLRPTTGTPVPITRPTKGRDVRERIGEVDFQRTRMTARRELSLTPHHPRSRRRSAFASGPPDHPPASRSSPWTIARTSNLAIESVLRNPEYEIVKARSGGDALRFLLHDDCAPILMDVQMPIMDGIETARLIRANERTRAIPIVFVTAMREQERYVARGYDAGADRLPPEAGRPGHPAREGGRLRRAAPREAGDRPAGRAPPRAGEERAAARPRAPRALAKPPARARRPGALPAPDRRHQPRDRLDDGSPDCSPVPS